MPKKNLCKSATAVKVLPQSSAVSKQIAFLFHEGPSEKEMLGGKGAGLVELVRMGVRVPAGFTITTAVARAYAQHGVVPRRLDFHLRSKIKQLEKATGRLFGGCENPLLVSVRSTAAVSMPGMLDTVLNLGMNPAVVEAMACQNALLAYDLYQRFLSMFGEVVLGIDSELFVALTNAEAESLDLAVDDLPVEALKNLCVSFLQLIEEKSGRSMPQSVWEQLHMAVEAVLHSWNNERAVTFRNIHHIDSALGTAVTVQAMVYGNRDCNSCSGVAYSRNATTGDAGAWGEFLVKSQGEAVVAGVRTAALLGEMIAWNGTAYDELVEILARLEKQRNFPVEVEFTVESGVLYCLQVRAAKLTAVAAATTAVQYFWKKKLTKVEALSKLSQEQVRALKHPGFDLQALKLAVENSLIARGRGASFGVATGEVHSDSDSACAAAAAGKSVILVRRDTDPHDLKGMQAAAAIVTMVGGSASHAAVVARGMGKPAVVGCGQVAVKTGEIISVDGQSGVVVSGAVPLAAAGVRKKEVNIFLKWAAEAEAKLWRAPQLNFGYVQQQENVERMIADFYLTDALVAHTFGTPLEARAKELHNRVHTQTAERLAVYLIVAIGGEIRHMNAYNPRCIGEANELCQKYKVERNGHREQRSLAQKRTNALLGNMKLADQLHFARLCQRVFAQGTWGGSVGGQPWANIAQAAVGFLSGELNHSLFADHTFDLQHNCGTVFGKNPMIGGDRLRVQWLLERKKHATSLAELYRCLSTHGIGPMRECLASEPVRSLLIEGVSLGLWRLATEDASHMPNFGKIGALTGQSNFSEKTPLALQEISHVVNAKEGLLNIIAELKKGHGTDSQKLAFFSGTAGTGKKTPAQVVDDWLDGKDPVISHEYSHTGTGLGHVHTVHVDKSGSVEGKEFFAKGQVWHKPQMVGPDSYALASGALQEPLSNMGGQNAYWDKKNGSMVMGDCHIFYEADMKNDIGPITKSLKVHTNKANA